MLSFQLLKTQRPIEFDRLRRAPVHCLAVGSELEVLGCPEVGSPTAQTLRSADQPEKCGLRVAAHQMPHALPNRPASTQAFPVSAMQKAVLMQVLRSLLARQKCSAMQSASH